MVRVLHNFYVKMGEKKEYIIGTGNAIKENKLLQEIVIETFNMNLKLSPYNEEAAKGAGFEVVDIVVDVAPEVFVQTAKEKKAHLIGLSVLLTTTMVGMKNVIKTLKEANLDSKVKVMIGGAPITQSYADEIGADGYAPDAASAVDKAKELLGQS